MASRERPAAELWRPRPLSLGRVFITFTARSAFRKSRPELPGLGLGDGGCAWRELVPLEMRLQKRPPHPLFPALRSTMRARRHPSTVGRGLIPLLKVIHQMDNPVCIGVHSSGRAFYISKRLSQENIFVQTICLNLSSEKCGHPATFLCQTLKTKNQAGKRTVLML